jgi:hypothetical protein
VSATPAVRRQHHADVQEDWAAWLPEETAQVFDLLRNELAVSCVILGVILNDALSASPDGGPAATPQLAVLFAGLFDRLVHHLGIVLTALEEHSRTCGTHPNAAPLRPEYFRSERARQVALMAQIRSRFSVSRGSMFGLKLAAIRKVISGLQRQARSETREIASGQLPSGRDNWVRLEVLQYDLNTCLQETTVILKSFFCALPGSEVPLFRNRLPV